MEADWEIEIGNDAPIIDACWPGLVDLRAAPERVRELPEARELPALAESLARLNSADSPVWTAKCDVWRVLRPGNEDLSLGTPHSEFDRFELDAPAESATYAMACYIDLLPRSDQQWIAPNKAIDRCEGHCARLRAVTLRCCRVDLVIRRALIAPDATNLGVTAYVTACGSTEGGALAQLESALAAFTDSVLAEAIPAAPQSKLK
jgi:hypothetical protein